MRFSGIGGIAAPPSEQTTLGALAPPSGGPPPTGSVLPFKSQRSVAYLASKALAASASGTVQIRLVCKPVGRTACAGTILLQSATSGGGHFSRQHEPRYVTLAKVSYRIAPGHKATLKLRLSPAARSLLARLHTLHARAVTHLDAAPGQPASTTVTLVTIRAASSRG